MKTITTTNARKQIAKIVNRVRDEGDVVAIGRRNVPEVLVIRFPREYNKEVSDIANINTYSPSFDFLDDEPELYTREDIR